jgi:hypothetical protein
MTKFIAALALVVGVPFAAHADDTTEINQNAIKIDDVNGQKNTTPGSDIDETITNNKMRAETGSKSRYSISSQLNYIGGSVDKPLAEDRPNIAGATGTTDAALIGGQISGKYNISSSQSLLAGVGVRWISPLQGSGTPKGYDGRKVDADNPYVVYQKLYKWSGVQSALQLQPTFFTNSNLVADGYVSTLALSQNNIFEIGHSGLSLGLYLMAQTGYYNNNSPAAKANQSDLTFNFDPFIEYQLTEKANIRTVTNLWNYEHARSMAWNTYIFDKVYQSVGVGYAITRDVFLYPNVQFLPDDIRSDRTNVALNTYINLF